MSRTVLLVSEICSSSLIGAKLRTANVQRHRANAVCNSGQTVSDYYKVSVFVPFFDHVVQEVDSRFSQHHQGLRRNPPDVGVTSGQKPCTKIIYIVLQTSVGLFQLSSQNNSFLATPNVENEC